MSESRKTLNTTPTNDYECIEACKSNPLVTLNPDSSYTIRDILLSKTAVGAGVTFNQVAKAIDELIQLKCPLINRMLEVAAFHCAIDELFIYFTNRSECKVAGFDSSGHGKFYEKSGVIVVQTNLPLSELLMHELTHAVDYFISRNEDQLSAKRSRKTFSTLFSQAMKNTSPLLTEQNEISSISQNADALGRIMVEHAPKCSSREWNQMMDRSRMCSSIFRNRRQNVTAKQELRRVLYREMLPYPEFEYSSEFLPTFLEHFVRAAYRRKVTSLQTWIVDYMGIRNEYTVGAYNANLFSMMWSSQPPDIVECYVNSNFRTTLDRYAVSIESFLAEKRIASLKDSEFYCISTTEPNRIMNPQLGCK